MPARYGFLGPDGTFSHAALRSMPAASDAELVPFATVTQAIDAVRSGAVDGALVPLENSVEGAVPATLDELAGSNDPLVIVAEIYLPVLFDLLARPGTALADIATLATHPHAEAQVRRFLLDALPGAAVTLLGSTAAGAAAVAAAEFDAAVAPPIAGELYGLDVLAHDIADHAGAVTRFVLLGRPVPPPPRTGNDRTTLVAYLREDHSGALQEILTEFAMRGVNLTRIESRPTKAGLGQYCFSIDCEGHIYDARVGDAVAAVHRICAEVRFLGSYVRAEGRQGPVPIGRTDEAFADSVTWLTRIRASGRDDPIE
jgi:prephenate dehydratase